MNNNVKVEVKGDKAHITIDLSKRLGLSSTGKSMNIGTTGGNQTIAVIDGQEIKLGLNCYTKAPAGAAA